MNAKSASLLVLGSLIWVAPAHPQRAHVHGSFDLNMVLEEKSLVVELVSPLVNVAGFEHWPPQTEEEQGWLDNAVGVLSDSRSLLIFPSEAKCKEQDVSVQLPTESTESEDIMALTPGDNGEDGHDGEDHGDEEHDEDNGHDHGEGDDKDEGETHVDIVVAYEFRCKKPERLDQVRVQAFHLFPKFESGKVFVLSENSQTFQELDPGNPRVNLRRE